PADVVLAIGPADQSGTVGRGDDDGAALADVQSAEKLLQLVTVERGGDDAGKAAVVAVISAREHQLLAVGAPTRGVAQRDLDAVLLARLTEECRVGEPGADGREVARTRA